MLLDSSAKRSAPFCVLYMASLARCCDRFVLLDMYMGTSDMCQTLSLQLGQLCLHAGMLVAGDMINALQCAACVCSLPSS